MERHPTAELFPQKKAVWGAREWTTATSRPFTDGSLFYES